jgi:pantetheine-phosphate adenylyltransferase
MGFHYTLAMRQQHSPTGRDSGHSDPAHGGAAKPGRAHHLAIYPGSFDPMTFGHLDVIGRGRQLFDELVVGVGRNPGKDPLFSLEERVEIAKALVEDLLKRQPLGAPVSVRAFSGLTVDFGRTVHASCILRGVRNLSDLQYEVQQAVTNREVAGIETAFVVAGQSFAYTSSSLIRQIAAMGDDLSKLAPMVPNLVIERLAAKKAQKHPALERLRPITDD